MHAGFDAEADTTSPAPKRPAQVYLCRAILIGAYFDELPLPDVPVPVPEPDVPEPDVPVPDVPVPDVPVPDVPVPDVPVPLP
ncbi:MAG: hypothetical protein JWL59_532 [Chthoniobacteraceae bacterium]|nr:hypothetical protein [Chthoniobacteraceae bacterium]